MSAVIAPQVAREILALVDASDRTDRALDRIAGDHGLTLAELRTLIARRGTPLVRKIAPPPDEDPDLAREPFAQLKRCSACTKLKPRTEFYPNPGTTDRLDSRCRNCNNKRNPTEARILRNRARSRAYAMLADAHRDEYDRLYAAAYNEAKAEHERLAAAAQEKGHADAKIARLKRGPKRAEQTDVLERLDVARCPTCHTHHDADHVCPACGTETAAERDQGQAS